MAEKDVVLILDTLAAAVGEGAYPGRSSEGTRPSWEGDPFKVLIATMLSQRTRDDNTRRASDGLFARYGTPEALAAADPAAVEELIRPAGFPRQKAKAVIECSRILVERFGSRVPESAEDLMSLPLVGRKTAACVRSYAFGLPAVCVDTHVHRISNLIGLVDTADPAATEDRLMAITPESRWSDINRLLVRHGQLTCLPRSPRCDGCPVGPWCDHRASSGR